MDIKNTGDFQRKWKCSFPWQQVIIDVLGNVHPCCHWSGNPPAGNIKEKTLEEIWNGPIFQKLRKGMAANDLKEAGCANCMVMKQKLWQDFKVNQETYADNQNVQYKEHMDLNYQEYADGQTVLKSTPSRISYSARAACNLKCYYCYQNNHKNAILPEVIWAKQIEPLLSKATEIIWGGGEPLIQKEFKRFIKNIDNHKNISFSTTTNGLPICEEHLEQLQKLPDVNFHLSIDGATPETYRTHRIGGEFEEVLKRLQLLISYRDKHLGNWRVSWGFLAMKSNIQEMATAIRWAAKLRIPISLGPVESYPMEERLDFYNDFDVEAKDYGDYIADAKEAVKEHLAEMELAISENPLYEYYRCDPSCNLDYIESIIEKGRIEFNQRRHVVNCKFLGLPGTYEEKRIVFYKVNTDGSQTVAGFALLGNAQNFTLRITPGSYLISQEPKYGYGFGEYDWYVRTDISSEINSILVNNFAEKKICKYSSFDKEMVVYQGKVTNKVNKQKIFLQLSAIHDTEETHNALIQEDGSFSLSVSAGYYYQAILSLNEKNQQHEILLWIGILTIKTDTYFDFSIEGYGSALIREKNSPDPIDINSILTTLEEVRKIMQKNIVTDDKTVLFVGNIANNSYNNAKFIREKGRKANVLMYDYQDLMGQPEWEDADLIKKDNADSLTIYDFHINNFVSPSWFYKTKSSLFYVANPSSKSQTNAAVTKIIGEFDSHFLGNIHQETLNRAEVKTYYNSSFTLNEMFGSARYLVLCDTNPIWGMFQPRPYIAFEHGTLRDIPFQNTTQGKLLALAYKKAEKVVITNVDNIEAAKKLGLSNYCFIPHPVDTLKFRPFQTSLRTQLLEKYQVKSIIFAPARHNWIYDPAKGLSVYKGNDKMIKALKILKDKNISTKMLLCDWGQEQKETRALINELDVGDYVDWLPPLSKVQLSEYFNAVDIVLDQFSIGTFGTTCVEAMACAKPVFIYLRPKIHEWAFPVLPPVVNVNNELQIAEQLMELLQSPTKARALGQKACQWVKKYHSKEVISKLWLDLFDEVFEGKEVILPKARRTKFINRLIRKIKTLALSIG